MNAEALDRWITGNYGEDQYRDEPPCEDDALLTVDSAEDDMEPLFCDCGALCRWDDGDKVWRCKACDTPYGIDGTAIRFGPDGRELR